MKEFRRTIPVSGYRTYSIVAESQEAAEEIYYSGGHMMLVEDEVEEMGITDWEEVR